MKRLHLFTVSLLCVVWIAAGSGCQSARMLTDLKPEQNPGLTSSSGRFFIADLSYSAEAAQSSQTEQHRNNILPVLRKESVKAYPGLFTDNPSGAIPLGLDLKYEIENQHLLKTLGWLYGTVLICGVVLPCPGQMDDRYEIDLRVYDGTSGLLAPRLTKSYRNETHIWISLLTPLALIPVPGESDVPKISGGLYNISKMEKAYYEGISRQVATAVAELVVKAEPEFWTAQPRRKAPSALSSGASPAAAGGLVLPAETAAPF